ncbi:phosphotransferase [Shimia sp.]|uniref:phosphotransferase n=1 Tax=Shimia sp. TaxID=1954381 RepID=UPI003BAB0D1C
MTDLSRIAAIMSGIGISVTSAQALSGGHSRETWLVTCADNRRVVLRFGDAHSHIEAAILNRARTVVPVPEVIAGGAGFLISEFVEGQTLEELLRAGIAAGEGEALAVQLGQSVAAIGIVEFDRPGFFTDGDMSIGKPLPQAHQLAPMCAEWLSKSGRFTSSEIERWEAPCTQNFEILAPLNQISRLVHSDMNPKNIIVDRVDGGWKLKAFIDWEFAHSGCPYADVGNFCRFASEYPKGFLRSFVKAFEDAAPLITEDWQKQARVLDMIALSDLASRPVGHVVGDKAEALIRSWSANGIPPLV